ncbi:hypothetical protein CGLO_12541 [Colletotrichum gloeosporioides Cg-14]|uniref:Uncharacterized protein n=1 Tax=Colletotrichum gloeosporioides (strain Cg-14) TaxID=1237896 RepID=T0LJB7_COLGC|nr:hypothetical protein CGLO_12541 [Colletotrichum gloeosporioides Cg-14]
MEPLCELRFRIAGDRSNLCPFFFCKLYGVKNFSALS